MKILISDHPDSMMPDHALEIETLVAGLGPDTEVEIYEYQEAAKEEFYEHLKDADALLTAFITVDAEAMDHAPSLKVVSINATGYDQVDLEEATKRGIGVCPVGEYCTWDVSETAIAYMFALNKHFKFYQKEIDARGKWDYAAAPQWPRMENQVLGIFGLGKIGKCTAGKVKGLVKEVIACDPYVDPQVAEALGVTLVERDELCARADVIVNHMCLTDENKCYFDAATFAAMKRTPIFINLGRGLCVDEGALVEALDAGKLRAFGTDVLYDETPDLASNPLVGRDDVIITPHAAFYSTTAIEDLERLSCQNIVHFLKGEKEKVFKLVNAVQ
ncbi:MAG: NAD(P)-dependent oxidoreductase [Raoultibacter sp.]